MAQALEPTESRARGRRLIIIFVVTFVILLAGGAFRYFQNRGLDDKTSAATAELRRGWRAVDLAAFQSSYAAAEMKVAGTGDTSYVSRLFPKASEATLGASQFAPDGTLAAEYLVEAAGRERCIVVHVSPPRPNRVQLQQRDGSC